MNDDAVRRWRDEEFPVTRECAYMNHAGNGPLPRRGVERMKALADLVSRSGDRRWLERNTEMERVRGLAARLLGARHAHEIAFVENTSGALSLIASGIDWKSGDNIVSAALEFPSNVYPWMQLAERGVELRRVPERDGRIDNDELLATLDERTRAVALSWVQYGSGFRSDLARLGAACRERGILFIVDGIQGVGALSIDVERDNVDICAGSSHKWLLAPEGIGLLYVSDRVVEQLHPVRSGWRSMRNMFDWKDLQLSFAAGARRFETGTLNVYGIVALGGALEIFLEIGAADLERRVLALSGRAATGLAALGFQVISSRRPGETSGIVAAVHPRRAAGELVKHLAQRDVVVAARLGRFRVSPHFYNSEDEIDRMLEELKGAVDLEKSP
ncbi:MAG TPA: aminotransferase class V-fold PLP-dependent enzyme [Thermoanaerobaculia bacterium]|nr:aminotransferase class V-fold PLP-dependent enzyme [Thermoanaerobaculia bacterium]